ncbi:MAG: WecB/TagA/CpsF family glycosyltransferase [Candidatus Omnitrophica bacterium]|nr:WecB/TagA/CpsF family glycosyltransferase [Candidatus Omnitrophota bacterium]
MNNSKSLLGIKINAVNRTDIVRILIDYSKEGCKRTAFYLNAHCVNLAYADPEYKDILNRSDLVYAGGMGVVWASRFLGETLPERVNILDFFDVLVGELKANHTKIFLLGGTQEVVKQAEASLKNRGLDVLGSRSGFFSEAQEDDVIREINALKPDILMAGLGVPNQEKWIWRHRQELDVNLCWAVGGVFDLIAGRLKWAPAWMRRSGLEWLYLSFQSPKRFLKRYLFGNPLFIYRVFRAKFTRS